MKIKKDDTVKILAGKDVGKKGKVLSVHPKNNRISVEGINIHKKHVRPKNENQKGQIVEVARSINASNAQIVCPSCNKPTRIGMRENKGKKERFCKKCNSSI